MDDDDYVAANMRKLDLYEKRKRLPISGQSFYGLIIRKIIRIHRQ